MYGLIAVNLPPETMGIWMAKKAKKKPGRPRLQGAGKGASGILGLRLATEMRKRLGNWATAQPDKPADSEAARRLLDRGLNQDGF